MEASIASSVAHTRNEVDHEHLLSEMERPAYRMGLTTAGAS
jgi:hypothetical protein